MRSLSGLIVSAWLLAACSPSGGPPGGGGMPPAAVSVATVVKKAVTEWDEFNGRIEAIESVEIRPRVGGVLEQVHFEDGALVKRGDLLFSIDDREYQAAFASARANSARANSRVELAQEELKRAERLLEAKAGSREEYEARRAELRQAQADVQSADAAQRQAELNLEFTQIRAPIDGRASMAMIRPGNLVMGMNTGASLLTTLVSIDPIYVGFEGDEQIFLRYQSLARAGGRPSSRDARNPVRVGLANETGFPHLGEMVFLDNQLNPQTGTIRARAQLSNSDGVFTPGLFARVQLLGATSADRLLIHDQAVLTDQDRRYVWVVGAKGEAERRDVQLGVSVEGLRVVEAGLTASDRVVVNGIRKIFYPGQPLTTTDVPMAEPNAAAQIAPPSEAMPTQDVKPTEDGSASQSSQAG